MASAPRRPPVVFPAFPFCEQSFTHGGPIPLLPLTPVGQDDVYAVLVTSDDLKPHARHFGSLRREREGLRSSLHLLLSILVSHRSNRADPYPEYQFRARSQLVVRVFVPDPAFPEVFAILLQVVVGAKPLRAHPSEPNVVLTEAPPQAPSRGGRGAAAAAAAAVVDEDDDSGGWGAAPAAAAEGKHDDGAEGENGGGKARGGRKRTLLAIYNPAHHVASLYDSALRDKLYFCVNASALLPAREWFVRSADTMVPTNRGPWDLREHVLHTSESRYLRDVLSELALWPAAALSGGGELTVESLQQPLTDAQRERLRLYEPEGFGFTADVALNECRAALSLPNALVKLETWLAQCASVRAAEARTWSNPRRYFDPDALVHASPHGCTVFVWPAQSHTPSLSTFLYTALPSGQSVVDILRQAGTQLALMKHPNRRDQLAVYHAVETLRLDDGRLWLSAMREHVQQVRTQYGGLSASRDLRTAAELTDFLSQHIYHERSIESEVGMLCAQLDSEARTLVKRADAPQEWELVLLRRQALEDLKALAASGRDNNTVLQSSYAFFEEGLLVGGSATSVDHAGELANYRRLFARRHFDDLVDGSALLAQMGIALRTTSGLISYWRESLWTAAVLSCSFLDKVSRSLSLSVCVCLCSPACVC